MAAASAGTQERSDYDTLNSYAGDPEKLRVWGDRAGELQQQWMEVCAATMRFWMDFGREGMSATRR